MRELLKGKQIFVITDEDASSIPIATLLISDEIDVYEVQSEVDRIKNEILYWQVSDILEQISIDYIELPFECISL